MRFFSKEKSEKLVSPIDGQLLQLADVSDPVFSEKMIGDGFAVEPSDGQIVSPVNGIIGTIFPTKHAITIKSKHGLNIMLHLGIDTVELKGAPFNILAKDGEKITAGQSIATMDLNKLKLANKSATVMTIITNMKLVKDISTFDSRQINSSDYVLTVNL
ncbi:PTS glucose transporter subunit IIA [Companilactobacillus allii]|uniref:PTS glucose transporter subunit IIABC n=1 Tax=Companilactobacillus allii TaxID=1847728 RepID=A0A1P8Q4Q6_9LACO|nr:PTS glucose transporter subunit IIA [Companilactobacillus allii]APX72837.1 PTS glucose transporter subunit IIABC [Companilactobacillus allii]USQ67624.1 PTS glucose transporter subunit IIA [Companilactobacillus allii]